MLRTLRGSSVPLWASAFVLAALVMIEAGKLPAHRAHAGPATAGDEGFSMLTAPSATGGSGQEYLYVIDGRDEVLYLYEVPNVADRRIVFKGGAFLPAVFAAGRGG